MENDIERGKGDKDPTVETISPNTTEITRGNGKSLRTGFSQQWQQTGDGSAGCDEDSMENACRSKTRFLYVSACYVTSPLTRIKAPVGRMDGHMHSMERASDEPPGS